MLEKATDCARRNLNTAQFNVDLCSVPPTKSAKAENLLKTKGKVSAFSLPKAENILKNKLLTRIAKTG